jgi:hypothetical protein
MSETLSNTDLELLFHAGCAVFCVAAMVFVVATAACLHYHTHDDLS